MNLSQLYYFRKLAELQHYGRASKELYITQPSLSNSIGNLEKELGVPLFERVGRNVRLTSYGREFNEHICTALAEIDKAVDLMKLNSQGLSGSIRIGTVVSIQSTYLPDLLHAFRERYGDNFVFDVYQYTTPECIQYLQDGKIDIAFCGQMSDVSGITYIPMVRQHLVVGVDKSHELASRSSVSFDELGKYQLISYRDKSYLGTIVKDILEKHNLKVMPSFDDEISAGTLVTAEKKVVAILLELLDNSIFRTIVSIPIEELPDPVHTVYLAYKEKAFHSIATERLIEFSKEYASKQQN